MKHIFLSIFALLPLAVSATDLSSPDGKYTMTVDGMTYSVVFNGKTIIERSLLGVDIDNRLFESALAVPRGEYKDWSSDLQLKGEERSSVDTTWVPLYGENAQIRDNYNQLVLHYEKGSDGQGTVSEGYDKRKYYAMDIVVRAYNEGIAFRYHFPETANSLFLHITGERTQFAMPEGTMAWYEEWAQGPYEKRSLKRPTPNPSLNGGENMLSHAELQGGAMQVEGFRSLINPDDALFANPSSMIEAIRQYCKDTDQYVPETPAEICRCIFDSLALRYKQVFGYLVEMASFPIEVLHIIGGGSLNKYLNQFTANATGVTVLAGPQEGTALGNIMVQAKAVGAVKDIWDMRRIIANSLELVKYEPQDKAVWDAAYKKYLEIVAKKG